MGQLTITLMSDLCVGNGESVGNGIDSDICTDSFGFPYIPAKRIMGCLREAMEQLCELGLEDARDKIEIIFGNADGVEGKFRLDDGRLPGVNTMHEYILYLRKTEEKKDYLVRQATEEKLIRNYTSVRGQTRIGNDGRAENGTLRFIRVLNQYDPIDGKPLTFVCHADSALLNDSEIALVEKACKALRHIGLNRNRGLGNILIKPDLGKNTNTPLETGWQMTIADGSEGKSGYLRADYQIAFESAVSLNEYMESGSQIKARTMIGAFSRIYLNTNDNKADETFNRLFLDGSVQWSPLNPVINHISSVPAPAIIMRLKNDNNKLINAVSCQEDGWKSKKPKSLDGYYASYDGDSGVTYVAAPTIETTYHNRINESLGRKRENRGLYMQESLQDGLVYGGHILFPKELLDVVKTLLSAGAIRLGRSRKVQYGAAAISTVTISDYNIPLIKTKNQEPVFVILESDLFFLDNAAVRIDNEYVRNQIALKAGLINQSPTGLTDICRYHVLTGYHAKWNMQKPKVQAVMGGSVYCFCSDGREYPSRMTVGESVQEGLGVIRLVSMEEMKRWGAIRYGDISKRTGKADDEIRQKLANMLLYNATMSELDEYAFRFRYKKDNTNLLKGIPTGRLRQMASEAEGLRELLEMVNEMKTSDVSSESKGKKEKSLALLNAYYENKNEEFWFEKMIQDQELLSDLRENDKVRKKIEQHWKDPILTLLHMLHYEKGQVI